MAWKFLEKHKNSGAVIQNEKGEKRIVLHPGGKSAKYATELKNNKRYTNGGDVKTDKPLTKEGRAYRSGYLRAMQDSNNAFIARNPDYNHKTPGGKNKALKRKNKKGK